MMQASPAAIGPLTPGQRISNFASPVSDGRTLIFYEFAIGKPLLMGICGADWTAEECARFVGTIHACAKQRGLQSVGIAGSADSPGEDPSTSVTVVDEDGGLRRRLFGALVEGADGALVVMDPNLRVLTGAVIERAALAASAGETAMEGLIDDGLGVLDVERVLVPPVAPVLIVPRVLPPELCRALIQSFEGWAPAASPMPAADGRGLAVDAGRKSRRDVMIQDPELERELMFSIGRRVRPELQKAFHYQATRFERIKLVCYSASEAGHFDAHRDNTAPATAHRRFALTLNLNTQDYVGGELEFPEYGADCAYGVPTGSAILFSCSHAHRVRPVTRGERYALITFAFGDDAVTA